MLYVMPSTASAQRRNGRGASLFCVGISTITCSCDGDERPFMVCGPNSPPGPLGYEILENRDAFVLHNDEYCQR